jgi:putative membrane-bound dehydrogenase-like protein
MPCVVPQTNPGRRALSRCRYAPGERPVGGTSATRAEALAQLSALHAHRRFYNPHMTFRVFSLAVLCLLTAVSSFSQQPLRIFLRGGPKTHGPAGNGLHEHDKWLTEWKKLLADRGATVDGALKFPSAEQLDKTDVLVMFAAEAGSIAGADRDNLEKFLMRGGGIVAIHDAVCGTNAQWFKTIIGGAWEHRHSKWFEGDMSLYYVDNAHPITAGCSNFDMDDEVYWDLHLVPEARILAASWAPDRRNTRNGRQFPHIYDIIPQIWTYEKDNYRAFVSIPGHKWKSFELPHYRAVLLRGIAWAGKREVDSLCRKEELATVRYPEGGPTPPEKAAAKLELHPEFNISLAAAEPLINKPISMDWDPAGRLWVAETPEYPNGRRGIKPDQKTDEWKDHGGLIAKAGFQERPARDRISILRDTDGDGIMDKKDIFYEGLDLVTSFVFHRDGVIVSQAPDILWLRDVDGDGKAEKVEKLYTGLGTFDTHAVINNLRWGMDGWIYATHGYSGGTARSPDGSKDFGRINSGVVRFKPDGSAFEQFSSKGGNTWGLDVAWDGEFFYTQPTSGDLLNHVVLPEYVLAKAKVGNTASFKPVIKGRRSNPLMKHEDMAYVQIDVVGGFTASAGCAIYDGGAWPEKYNYSYFTTEPTINIIHHELVTPDGSTYTANKDRDPEFIGGRDLWFRPIETRIGPDGALYILDFYNQAVIHNDTRGPRHNNVNAAVRPDRDHYFGRIWRVHHKQAKKLEVPNLSRGYIVDLMKALEHPNRPVRMNAHRLLVEKANNLAIDPLQKVVQANKPAHAKVHALRILSSMGRLEPEILTAAANDHAPAVRKAAFAVAQERPAAQAPASSVTEAVIIKGLQDSDPRVQLNAALASSKVLSSITATAAELTPIRSQLITTFEKAQDLWLRSAIMSVVAERPEAWVPSVAVFPDSISFITELCNFIAVRQDTRLVSQAVQAVSQSRSDKTKQAVLEALGKGLKRDTAPEWNDDLRAALAKLLRSENSGVRAAALPLVTRWDKQGTLRAESVGLVKELGAKLAQPSGTEDEKLQLATSLVGAREIYPEIIPTIGNLLGKGGSADFQRKLIEALGAINEPLVGTVLVNTYPALAPEIQEATFAQVIKRGDWSAALVESLKAGKVTPAALGPANIYRLRNHTDKEVAQRASAVMEELRGPEAKEKAALIVQLEPEVSRPGDATAGKAIYVQNCGVCHKYDAEGRDVGPELTGMGAHGVHELLVHILDPNHFVEENYVAVSIETKDDQSLDGIVVRENRSAVTLRNNTGEIEVKTSDIQTRRNTGRSLMPEGFEALGTPALRDLLTYMGAGESKYRIIDLKNAYTADSRQGIFSSTEAIDQTLQFRRFGVVTAGAVPFEIVSPMRSVNGNNVVVLRGGQGFAKRLPQKVEIPAVGIKASRLHFLGGVGGWAWPFGGQDRNKNVPVAKVTVQYAGGKSEEFVLRNGVEFVDYIDATHEAPGSKQVPDLLRRGQVRTFSRELSQAAPIERITLESYDNGIAPVFVAITAETGDLKATEAPAGRQYADASSAAGVKSDASLGSAKPRAFQWGQGVRVLITGGGSSHDFDKWFNKADTAILSAGGKASVNYTEDMSLIAPALKDVNVLYLSHNKPINDAAARSGIFEHVDAGKGLLIVHPALWYNWKDWPEYNRVLAGGGSRGHDKYGEFTVKVTDAAHPIMEGVPGSFTITDELYWFEPDLQGTPIEVLATAHSPQKNKTYPQVFIVKHPKARIVGITLGHDGKAHDHPAYQQLLRNSLKWVSGK